MSKCRRRLRITHVVVRYGANSWTLPVDRVSEVLTGTETVIVERYYWQVAE